MSFPLLKIKSPKAQGPDLNDGRKVVIQEHSAGHQFGQGGLGDQGAHFNVRPIEKLGQEQLKAQEIIILGEIMDAWLSFVSNPEKIRNIFKELDPDLGEVSLYELRLHREGKSLRICFDLLEYPGNPPLKWVVSKFSTVQIVLAGYELSNFSMTGWGGSINGSLKISPDRGRIFVGFNSELMTFRCGVDFLCIESVSAY